MSIIETAMQRVRKESGAAAAGDTSANAFAPSADMLLRAKPLQARKNLPLHLDKLDYPGLGVPEDQRRRHVQEYRTIKRALLDGIDHAASASNLIMVTSALSGDGKTYTSFNLARSLALELDRRVILVDADVLRQGLSGALGLQDAPGLVDVLRDERLSIEDALFQSSDQNLSVLPAGRFDDNANELLTSDRMARFAAQLAASSSRQITVFDSSPLLQTSEAGALAAFVGQIVLVVRAFVTGQDDVREALGRLDQTKRISAVFNAWAPSGPFDKHYGTYYGAESSAASASKR